MKAIVFLLVLIVPFQSFALTAQWEYDATEVERVDRFRLYYSETSGGPYTALLEIEKSENQTTYEKTIPRESLPATRLFFVVTAENAAGESDYSNEAMADLTPLSIPFNLKIIME